MAYFLMGLCRLTWLFQILYIGIYYETWDFYHFLKACDMQSILEIRIMMHSHYFQFNLALIFLIPFTKHKKTMRGRRIIYVPVVLVGWQCCASLFHHRQQFYMARE